MYLLTNKHNEENKMQIAEKVDVKINTNNGIVLVSGVIYKFLKSGRVQVRLNHNQAICSFNLSELVAV